VQADAELTRATAAAEEKLAAAATST